MSDICPYCGDKLVLPYTGRNDILIVGEYPSEDDKKSGVPFSGQAGEILRHELARNGNNLWDNSLCNFWMHDKNKKEECFNESVKMMTREMAGRKVLLLGSEMSKFFTGKSVVDLCGLEVTSPMFPMSVQFVMVGLSPKTALHAPVGEFRLMINKFMRRCNE